jgi:hypothetical protein
MENRRRRRRRRKMMKKTKEKMKGNYTGDDTFFVPNAKRMRSCPYLILSKTSHCKDAVIACQGFDTNMILIEVNCDS